MNHLVSDQKTAAVGVAIVCVLVSVILAKKRRGDNGDAAPPDATGGVFLLGHALEYKNDPPGFLQRQEEAVGKVYKINLAGRRMIIVGSDAKAMQQVSRMPESMVSARQAVADIGFEYTLGELNVYKGTDWHKRILRDAVLSQSQFESHFLPRLYEYLVKAFKHETSKYPKDGGSIYRVDDLFTLFRRCILRASLDCFVSPQLLSTCSDNGANLLNAIMEFQNDIEDATAKAAVLPRCISVPLVLRPVARTRQRLTKQLATLLEPLLNDSNEDCLGPWLQIFQKDRVSSQEASELVLGLMFAAHKNPAIGAAQAYCFLQTKAEKDELQRAQLEAKSLVRCFAGKSQSLTKALLEANTLRRSVLETMRLTAHSIGAIRLVQEPFELETESGIKYQINKRDTLSICHITSHTNQEKWGKDASQFKLNRCEWNADKSDMACPVDSYKLTTFSYGLHKCPGERVAMTVMELMVALLLVHDTQLTENKIARISYERATLAQREGPVPVTIDMDKKL